MEKITLEDFGVEQAVNLVKGTLANWLKVGLENIPDVIAAMIFLLIFIILAKIFRTAFAKIIERSFDSPEIANLLSTILKVIILAIGVFIALGVLGLQSTVTSLLAGAGIIGLAIGFAFQDLTENLIAGVLMGLRKPLTVGDVVQTQDVMGTIVGLNLRNTLIDSFAGQRIIIPNKDVFTNKLINYSVRGKRRIEILVGVSYDADLEQAEQAIKDELTNLGEICQDQEPEVYAVEFGNSSINLKVWFWIDYPNGPSYMMMIHKGVMAVKNGLTNAGINIPFPIRTIHMESMPGQNADELQTAQKG